MNIFERASRANLRFIEIGGCISTEDLWDLNLQNLDNIYKKVNGQIKEAEEESFAFAATLPNTSLQLKLLIVKHIITSKQQDAVAAQTRAANATRKQKVLQAIANQEDSTLSNATPEELAAMLEELGE